MDYEILQDKLFKLIQSGNLTDKNQVSLIEKGVDITAEYGEYSDGEEDDFLGRQPLSLACELGNISVVKLLLDHGAASVINVVDGQGLTPLTIAYTSENMPLIDLLLEHWNLYHIDDKSSMNAKSPVQYLTKEADIHAAQQQVVEMLQSDEELKAYPELAACMDAVTYNRLAMSIWGGNADDKVEYTVLHAGKSQDIKIEYFQSCNWSYGDLFVWIKWSNGQAQYLLRYDREAVQEVTLKYAKNGKKEVIHLDERIEGRLALMEAQADGKEVVKLSESDFFSELKSSLGVESVPAGIFNDFLIVLLSRKVQDGYINRDDHGLSGLSKLIFMK